MGMNQKALYAVLLPAIVAGGYAAWPKARTDSVPAPLAEVAEVALAAMPAPAPVTVPVVAPVAVAEAKPVFVPETFELLGALESEIVRAECVGNGRDQMRVKLTNSGKATISVKLPLGQVFESGRNAVLTLRAESVTLDPGQSTDLTLSTAAIRSTNKVVKAAYRPSFTTVPKADLFLAYLQDHGDLTPAAVQTAVLALTENLPVSSVAKFDPPGGALPSKFNTNAFRVETVDILLALKALRDMGAPEKDIAMTVDPQLKIEAMIDPVAHGAAMHYYGMTPETEWTYWKTELLEGDRATRHYALFGIARYYPDIALQMLPKWARETKTDLVFRQSAIQALAETGRSEALPLLTALSKEFGADSDLGRTATASAEYLGTQLAKSGNESPTVALQFPPETRNF
jgi:hypothetical protein